MYTHHYIGYAIETTTTTTIIIITTIPPPTSNNNNTTTTTTTNNNNDNKIRRLGALGRGGRAGFCVEQLRRRAGGDVAGRGGRAGQGQALRRGVGRLGGQPALARQRLPLGRPQLQRRRARGHLGTNDHERADEYNVQGECNGVPGRRK